MFKNADPGILFRTRDFFGLQLTRPSVHYKKMQITKSHLLQNSSDPTIRSLYQHCSKRESSFRHKNLGSHFLSTITPIVNYNIKFQGQQTRQGLGTGRYVKPTTFAEERKLFTKTRKDIETEPFVAHSHTLVLQGVWTHWLGSVSPFDLSWSNILYRIHPRLLSFVLNSMLNSLPSPDMLRLWTYRHDAPCMLCRYDDCTLHHILVNCPVALFGQRYIWRHDSVLLSLQPFITAQIKYRNSLPICADRLALSSSFVRPGTTAASRRSKRRASILDGATDWRVLVDFENAPIIFPPEITISNKRPDINIWSITLKHVVLFELTCGAEEGVTAAVHRKTYRYHKELIPAIEASGWTYTFRTMEVCARGMVAHSTRHCLQLLGFSYSHATRICKELSIVVARCSYTIWVSRAHNDWDRSRALITPNNSRCTNILDSLNTHLVNSHNHKSSSPMTHTPSTPQSTTTTTITQPPTTHTATSTTTLSTVAILNDIDISDFSDLDSIDDNTMLPSVIPISHTPDKKHNHPDIPNSPV